MMFKVGDALQLSASDLVDHLNCRHLTNLDLAVAEGRLAKPLAWNPAADILRERGARHEKAFVAYLVAAGYHVKIINGGSDDPSARAQTIDAMRSGADIVVQGVLQSDGWRGRTDVLRKKPIPSSLGPWSYEVIDTKLAQETKGGTVLQLCLYSDLVGAVQGLTPERTSVVTPWTDYEPKAFRTADYGAYYRHVRASLNRAVAEQPRTEFYPEPVEHCDVCRWRERCEQQRRADDHLSLVAGISKTQMAELQRRQIATVASLATTPIPLPWKPDRGAAESYERVREQARIQVRGREVGRVLYEPLPVTEGFGLCCLPPPSHGDIFFDLEGDPFVGEGGLEYLFGYSFRNEDGTPDHVAQWALSRVEEKAAFESFIDFVIRRLERYPDLHIYHYAPYEPGALKRLMGRYASRENELDRMLRSKLFVDLYGVVRHSLRASVESYSIKRLEPLYGFERETRLPDANLSLFRVQTRLELNDVESLSEDDRGIVEGYNRDDCLSTWRLRDWLEGLRSELIWQGWVIDRPNPVTGDPSEALNAWQQKVAAVAQRLTRDIPVDVKEQTAEQHARWLLANLLDWHRREEKSVWWDYFRLAELGAEELLDEPAGLSGLTFCGVTGGTEKTPVHRYSFPPQETDLRGEEDLRALGGAKIGSLQEISLEERWIEIKKRRDSVDMHPEAVFGHNVVPSEVLRQALLRIGDYVAEHGITGPGEYQAAREILLRATPSLGDEPMRRDGESALDAALRLLPRFTSGVLPIQGPPGSGKTYTGARMICALVAAGKKVGVTANSHKVIRNLLDQVARAADDLGITALTCLQKVSEKETAQGRLQFTTDNASLFSAIENPCQVAGGTAWLWARPEALLFVDEASQVSLANIVAVSHAAQRIVLLGDPQQLNQPRQGSHPEGTDVSALDHVLNGEQTIAPDRGLFLEDTWRLHPSICAFTSELFYENRLRSRPGLEQQKVHSHGRVAGAGLRLLPVSHVGNQSSCPEEADAVHDLVREILDNEATWTDRDGCNRRITLGDILIVAPYNAQVFELQDRLPGARIGTVDKFQGREAPIVIYSMTTSSYADAPRGMEFLYSLNRLNVATSRAKCVCVMVASPSVLEPNCRTPHQMKLANAFCRYRESARLIIQECFSDRDSQPMQEGGAP